MEDVKEIDPEIIKTVKDTALRAINSIRFHKMGRPIGPVWPRCPRCNKLCVTNELFSVSQTGLCIKCAGAP